MVQVLQQVNMTFANMSVWKYEPADLCNVSIACHGLQVNYAMADSFTRSDLNASCTCLPTRRLRQTVRSVLDMKFFGGECCLWPNYRLEYLQTKVQENVNAAELHDLGIAYVGDKVVSMLFLVGEIYGVTVRKPDEQRR